LYTTSPNSIGGDQTQAAPAWNMAFGIGPFNEPIVEHAIAALAIEPLC
jgi:hypothetical protein